MEKVLLVSKNNIPLNFDGVEIFSVSNIHDAFTVLDTNYGEVNVVAVDSSISCREGFSGSVPGYILMAEYLERPINKKPQKFELVVFDSNGLNLEDHKVVRTDRLNEFISSFFS